MAPLTKTVVVYGATGAQGGAVARSLLQSTAGFHVRALTRNPSSPPAQKLASLGAEVIKADGFNQEEMRQALTGAWGFWLNTNHHDPAFPTPEGIDDTIFGCNLISLAADLGVKVMIYSTCERSANYTNGKVLVKGYEEKHNVFQHALRQPGFDAVIGAIPGWYMENFLSPEYAACFGGFPTQPDPEGYLNFASPYLGGPGEVPWISITDDFGDMIHGMFLDPLPYHRQTVQCFSDTITFQDMAQTFTDVTGKKARFVPQTTPADFPTYGVPALEEIRDIFTFTQYTNGNFFGPPNDIKPSQALKKAALEAKGEKSDPELITVREYFEKHFG
ncbi:NmrA-like family protein [Aspergillus sclerotioniger CBS 115572]|uniref:NmrA-like family protein n=1 Tax=Aspergillus sclerotioniger CBS 115572 TaxID=1450535 RepID=A0A317XDW5_9EURO|nr:NmrA-like family protein [Aspergillus sclerotioniger CBS 115572]PWY96729.1 NmrA-like family protein [Aspergillus sclerotioniger CBS 115572]